MEINDRIREKRLALGLSQGKLAEQCGWGKFAAGRIANYESKNPGTHRNPKASDIKILAKVLNTTPEHLQFGVAEEKQATSMQDIWATQPKTYVPILEWSEIIQWLTNDAPPLPMEEPGREFVPNPIFDQPERRRIFAVRVKNDTMCATSGNALTFPPHTILIADPSLCQKFYSGHYLIGYRSRAVEPIFRQYIEDGDKAYLKPLNPQYPMEEMARDFSVLGVVIARLDSLV